MSATHLGLADVLRAIANTEHGYFSVDQDGNCMSKQPGKSWHFVEKGDVGILAWNLAVPLDDQDPSVIEFLHSIICV